MVSSQKTEARAERSRESDLCMFLKEIGFLKHHARIIFQIQMQWGLSAFPQTTFRLSARRRRPNRGGGLDQCEQSYSTVSKAIAKFAIDGVVAHSRYLRRFSVASDSANCKGLRMSMNLSNPFSSRWVPPSMSVVVVMVGRKKVECRAHRGERHGVTTPLSSTSTIIH